MTKNEIIKARDEWDAQNAEQKAKFDVQYDAYKAVRKEFFDSVEARVRGELTGINLNLDVVVGAGYDYSGVRKAKVKVSSNEHRIYAEDYALSWSLEVKLDEDGEPEKKSNSWSGLQATTAVQIESLKETVRALEILNNIDWKQLLNVNLPDWNDYITERDTIGKRPDFESQIVEAEVSELIGTNTLVKGVRIGGYNNVWYLVVGETPKQFKVVSITNHETQEEYLERVGMTLAQVVEENKGWASSAHNVSKEKFVKDILSKTIKTMSF